MASHWHLRACVCALLLLLLPPPPCRAAATANAEFTSQCDIRPLTLAWSNTTVSQDGLAVTRGIEIGIGTPNQIFAFRPSTSLNNTRINNVLGCGSAKNDSCIGGAGGVFDSSASSTYTVSIKARWNGSQIDQESSTGAYVYFNDFAGFQRNGNVDGFPLVMNSELGGGPQSALPLGTNSSFLRATVMGGVAPSTAFGLWTGSRSLAPVDGLLVIGGFDTARVNGSFIEFPIREWNAIQPCPLQVSITNITYSGQSLFANASQSFTACIEPSTQRSVFPPDIARAFAQVTKQDNSSYSGMTYPASDPPQGSLTITLSNNYTTTITRNELFNLLRGSDQYGRYSVTNNTVVEAGVADNRNRNPEDVVPTLGGLFLTFNYLVVDYSTGKFRLAPSVSSDVSVGPPQLETICTPSPGPSSDPSSNATSTSESKPGSSSSRNVGAIAGGTVGGVLGVALVGGIIFFLLRHRQQQQEDRKLSVAPSEVVQSPIAPSVELPADSRPPPQELPTSKPSSTRANRAGTPTSNDPNDDDDHNRAYYDNNDCIYHDISPASPPGYFDNRGEAYRS